MRINLPREQAFRHTIEDSIPSGIVAVNTEGALTYVNQAFCELVGWTEAELLGCKPPFPFFPANESDNIQKALANVTRNPVTRPAFEFRFQHRNGKSFDVLMLVSPVNDPNERVTGWLASVTDITERRQAERRLHVQYRIALALSQAANLKAAAGPILAAIGQEMGWSVGVLRRIMPGAEDLECVETWKRPDAHAEEFEAACHDTVGARNAGISSRVMATGQPLWVPDVSQFKHFPRATAAAVENVHGACCFPIKLGDEILGTIEFFSHKIREPDDMLLQWMVAIGSQIGQFMERQMAQEALRRAHDELELRVRERTADLLESNQALEKIHSGTQAWLENELLEITEKERRRIGLDLHDDLGQKLTGITLMVKGLEMGLSKKKLPEATEARNSIAEQIQQAVDHASNLARDLAPTAAPQSDLPTALARTGC